MKMGDLELPLNLDDGEQWLPSGIFLGEARSRHDRVRRIGASSCCSSTDELAQRLASLSLLRSRARAKAKSPAIPSFQFQRFRPQVQCGSADPFLAPELYRLENGVSGARFMVSSSSSSMPVRECNVVKPTRLQVESILEARARLLMRQQNRFQSRLMPVQGRGGIGGTASSGGTGVFLPRARVLNTSTNNNNNNNNNNAGFGKKQRTRNRREVQAGQQSHHFMKRAGWDNLEEQFQPSPEIVLPKEWTY